MYKIILAIAVLIFSIFVWWLGSVGPQSNSTVPIVDLSKTSDAQGFGGDDPAFGELLALSDWLITKAERKAAATGRDPRAEAERSKATKIVFKKFSKLARKAAIYIDSNDGPNDLACIFRGMAEDADKQLADLLNSKTQAEQSRIWSEAVYLFSDVRAVLFPVELPPEVDLPYNGETCSAE